MCYIASDCNSVEEADMLSRKKTAVGIHKRILERPLLQELSSCLGKSEILYHNCEETNQSREFAVLELLLERAHHFNRCQVRSNLQSCFYSSNVHQVLVEKGKKNTSS